MGKTGKKKEKKKRKKRSQVFHCVHSDTLYSRHESLIAKQKKKIDGLTCQAWNTCHESLIIKQKEI